MRRRDPLPGSRSLRATLHRNIDRGAAGRAGLLALLAALAADGACGAEAPETPLPRCPAASVAECVQWCREQNPGAERSVARAACYDALEVEPAPPADTPLQRLWNEPRSIGFQAYQPSYLLVTRTDHPDDAPTSPNPDNQVPYSYNLEHTEMKFQFSLKALVLPGKVLGNPESRNSLWFGYTQQSYWQAFDGAHSRPFIESNYEPELIYSRRLDGTTGRPGAAPPPPVQGWHPVFLNIGLQHQSNGQSDPRSRSWNRAYAQLGLTDRLSDEDSLAMLLRPWWRFREPAGTDNNPDIQHYLGHGDAELDWWHGDHLFSLLARERSLQFDLATPLLFFGKGSPKDRALQLHLQLFTGYGESLIDYNQRHTTLGLGISIPYGL
jgi:outer membrane phospholipase A